MENNRQMKLYSPGGIDYNGKMKCIPPWCIYNNRKMKLYYLGRLENKKQMKLYSPGCTDNNKQMRCIPLGA